MPIEVKNPYIAGVIVIVAIAIAWLFLSPLVATIITIIAGIQYYKGFFAKK